MCVLVSISPVGLPIVSAINYGLAQGTYKYHISTIYSLAIERDTKFLYSIMRNNLDLVHQVEHSILGAISWQRKAHKIQWYETNCRKIKLGGGSKSEFQCSNYLKCYSQFTVKHVLWLRRRPLFPPQNLCLWQVLYMTHFLLICHPHKYILPDKVSSRRRRDVSIVVWWKHYVCHRNYLEGSVRCSRRMTDWREMQNASTDEMMVKKEAPRCLMNNVATTHYASAPADH